MILNYRRLEVGDLRLSFGAKIEGRGRQPVTSQHNTGHIFMISDFQANR
jgi:hypothetical protein